MDRRTFMRLAGLGVGLTLVPFGRHGWLALSAGEASGRRLVVVFLRGAVDGLSVVVPVADSRYYEARSSIAISKPGSDGGALGLDGRFGLHPALSPLVPLWRAGGLAFVHACGSPDPTRSHFDAQDYMESATPGVKGTPDGWMNRLLAVLPGTHAPTQAVSFSPTIPRILSGRMAVANMALGSAAARPTPLDRPAVGEAFDRLYGGEDNLSKAYREGREARSQLMSDLSEEMAAANQGAPPAEGFRRQGERLGRMMAKDPSIQLAFVALGGWDTHVNQGAVQGQLAGRLKGLGEGLAGLSQNLGAAWRDTVVLVLSEFGRTVHENGNRGTDHGHGNVMWVLGGPAAGGKVYGEWPGLSSASLYQGRDLAVTTDFRQVLAAVLERHLRLQDRQLEAVFPSMPPRLPPLGSILRG